MVQSWLRKYFPEDKIKSDRLITRSIERGTSKVQPLNDSEGGKTIANLNPLGILRSDRIQVLFKIYSERL